MFSKTALFNYLPLILVILLATLLRFLWLDKVPNAIGGDELVYVLTAKSIALSGSDLTGVWNPLSIFLFNYPPNQAQAELPYFLFLPLVGLTKFSLFTAKATAALIGVFNVFLIYLISSKLFNKKVGIIAGFIAAVNPWFIYISRTAYEAMPAVFFYLIAFYVFMFYKGRKILLSIPVLILAFYSYIATKAFFLPFVLTMVCYSYFYLNKRKFKKEYLTVLIISVLLFLFYVFYVFSNTQASRIGDLFTPNNPAVAQKVNEIRSISMRNPLTNIFVNKYTVYFRIISVKLFSIFSADYLFLRGDSFFSIYSNGVFYYLDAIFLFLGLVFVFAKQRRLFFLLLFLTFIATIPQLIYRASSENFTIHFTMIFPFMIIFIGVGIWETINFFKNRAYFYISGVTILILYLLLLLNFMNIYFYQFPLRGNFDFPVRLVAKYSELSLSRGGKVFVYSTRKGDIFSKYLFYANALNKSTYLTIRKNINGKNYSLGNIKFFGCDNTINPVKTKGVIIYDSQCGSLQKSYPHIVIARLSDGGESYGIYNDSVCKGISLKSYPSGISIGDFSIESMSSRTFCRTYITSP